MKSMFSAGKSGRRSLFPSAWIPALGCFLWLIVELLNQRLFTTGLRGFFRYLVSHPWAALVSLFLILLTLMPAYFLRRRVFYCTLVSVLWLTAGGVNGFILLKRSTPFTVSDIAQLRAGIDTLPNYLPVWAMILLAAVLVLVLAAVVLLFLRGPKNALPAEQRVRHALIALLITVSCLAFCWGCGAAANQLSTVFANLGYAYQDYGFPYCFLQTCFNQGIDRPSNYGTRRMDEIAAELPPETDSAPQDVNILILQLESLVDPEEIEGLTLSEDPMPNLHALERRYTSGYLTVPVVGAGTANTEFEVLTGMSCRFFGPGEYPYKSRAQKMPIESVASALGALGYTSHAIHNNSATFYARDTVYANLGFDDFTSIEYMPETGETPNGWARDAVLTSQILQAMDQTAEARDFVFTVTVQCHGSYPENLENPAIRVLECPENVSKAAMEYYVNQLRETDAFVGELIAALEARDEPTVAVFYGDHLPALNLKAAQLESGSMYQTDYVVWDNLGLEPEHTDVSAFQLAADVLARLKLSRGLVLRFHQSNQDAPSYQADLQAIEYDLLYGKQYLYRSGGAPTASDLTLGVAEIAITDIVQGDGCFYVLGENFTPYCRVAADGEPLETVYQSGSSLRVDEDPAEVDWENLSIQVVGKHRELLSQFDD